MSKWSNFRRDRNRLAHEGNEEWEDEYCHRRKGRF